GVAETTKEIRQCLRIRATPQPTSSPTFRTRPAPRRSTTGSTRTHRSAPSCLMSARTRPVTSRAHRGSLIATSDEDIDVSIAGDQYVDGRVQRHIVVQLH